MAKPLFEYFLLYALTHDTRWIEVDVHQNHLIKGVADAMTQ